MTISVAEPLLVFFFVERLEAPLWSREVYRFLTDPMHPAVGFVSAMPILGLVACLQKIGLGIQRELIVSTELFE